MNVWYSVISDFIATALMLYIVAIYLLTPRKGGRYVNYLGWILLYMAYLLIFRYRLQTKSLFLYLLQTFLVIGVLIHIIYADALRRKIFALLYLILIGLLTDLITAVVGSFLVNSMWEKILSAYNESIYTNMMKLMALFCSNVVTMVCTLIYLCIIRHRDLKLFFSFLLLPVYHVLVGAGYFMLCNDFTERIAAIGLLMGIFSILLSFMVLHFLDSILKKSAMQQEVKGIEIQQKREYVFFEKESQQVEQIRLIRHDFVNQLQVAYRMMDEPENVEKVKKMLADMKKNLEEK